MDNDKYIGRLLDNRYEILEVIGVGGMAVVYKARCHRLNRLVAIKILKDEFSQDGEFRDRFHAEGQAVAMLSHPNIVSVYDVSVADDADYIVMELIDGISLKQYMEKKGVLNWKETLHFAMQIGKALEHAHSRGIVHRDIKPHNVMVLKNGSIKVADFGIARLMSKSNTLTKEALGSVHYISPEQAKGGRVDNRSDLYSLGVVMYEMLSGRPPYDGESPVAVAFLHINGGAPLPTTYNPNMPSGLEQIIMKAMSLEPNDRYPTATAMLYDMDELRKNPVMLFDFQNVPIDDATRLPASLTEPPEEKPVTLAQQKEAARTGSPVRRSAAGTMDREPRRRRPTRARERDESSQSATIAIVACSVGAVIAIVIFMVMLFNGDFLSPVPEMVQVPRLQGESLAQIRDKYPDFVIVEGDSAFSSVYEKGQIMTQNPKSGIRVAKGSTITVVVSLGREEEVKKTMTSLVGLTEAAARKFLDDMDMDLVIRVQQEVTNDVAPGQVVRTDPAPEETLTEGQAVTLYIAKEKNVKKAPMPSVVGLHKTVADTVLQGSDFTNFRFEPVDSDKVENMVVGQSVPEDEMTALDQEIIIYISKGPAVPPTTMVTQPSDPTEGSDPVVTESVRFNLPEGRPRAYYLRIVQGDLVVQEDILIQPDQTTFSLRLSGTGITEFKLYIDGEFYRSAIWDFSANE